MLRLIPFVCLAIAASAVGCFSLSLDDHTVRCHESAPACPDGYFCGSDGYCYANGHIPPAPPTPDMTAATKTAGETCTFAGECVTGYCVDGVCCSTDCSDSCNACNVPGSEGTCSPIPNGQTPGANHPSCGPDPTSTCGRDGTCDGKGFCRKYDIQTVCKASSCDVASNLFVAESTCDGNGNCVSPPSITCAPFVCKPDMTACYPTCTPSGSECSAGNTCTNGSCGLKVDGSTCAAGTECQSGKCIDQVCCHTSCDGQCQACDLTTSRGTCATVPSGQPHYSHPACNASNSPTCAGSCTGDPTSCTYKPTSTLCQAQSCSGAVVSYAKYCDGAGNCVPPNPATLTCQAPPANGTATCNGANCGISCNKYYGPDASGTQCVPVWTQEATFAGNPIRGIWGSSATDVYAVSLKTIYHSAGDGNWTAIFTIPSSQTVFNMDAISGGNGNVWAVGDSSIYHSSNGGSSWTNEYPGSSLANLYAVAGGATSTSPLFAVGNKVYSWSGTSWSEIVQTLPSPLVSITPAFGFGKNFVAVGRDGNMYKSDNNGIFSNVYTTGWTSNIGGGIWGVGVEYFAVGPGGKIVHGDANNAWGTPTQTTDTTNNLTAVYGLLDSSNVPTSLYAVGASGTILYSPGNGTWTTQTSNTTANLSGVWESGPNDVYAVGYDIAASQGVIMRLK